MRFAILFIFFNFPCIAGAQMVAPTAVPTGSIPVVFLDGYQLGCIGDSGFKANFGDADTVLQASNLVTVYFDNCSVPNIPPIETLGAAFGQFLASLKYTNGTPVPLVDVVAHSMGGLIVRAYLSGMQVAALTPATFSPPATPGIRKAIFLATPHFGTYLASLLGDDQQTREMALGSQFLFDLNTWNQGTDDLSGVDALAVAGNGGTGLESVLAGSFLSGFDDGVVELTSASIGFAITGRTRVVPDCHTSDSLVVTESVCSASTPAIAQINDASNVVGQIITSFITGTSAWTTLGQAIEANNNGSTVGGLLLGVQDLNGVPQTHLECYGWHGHAGSECGRVQRGASRDSPRLCPGVAGQFERIYIAFVRRRNRARDDQYCDREARTVDYRSRAGRHRAVSAGCGAGSFRYRLRLRSGERGDAVSPAVSNAVGRCAGACEWNRRPGAICVANPDQFPFPGHCQLHFGACATYGEELDRPANCECRSGRRSAEHIHVDGLANGPAAAENAVTGVVIDANTPLHAGDYVALYMTGMDEAFGFVTTVTVGGQSCAGGQYFFVGPVASYVGLDQVNCQIPSGVTGAAVPVIVTTNGRASNTATLNIQ